VREKHGLILRSVACHVNRYNIHPNQLRDLNESPPVLGEKLSFLPLLALMFLHLIHYTTRTLQPIGGGGPLSHPFLSVVLLLCTVCDIMMACYQDMS
jgi:hypothetical protein